MADLNQLQDYYALLIADLANKRVLLPTLRNDETTFEPHDPKVDLTDVPVFAHHPIAIGNKATIAGLEAVMAGQFRLPYPRMALICYLPPDLPSIKNQTGQYAVYTGRHYVVVAEEEDNGFLFFGFMRHDNMRTWAKQVWQVFITAEETSVAYESEGEVRQVFLDLFTTAVRQRVQGIVGIIHQMSTHLGSLTASTGGHATSAINKRRLKHGMVPVPVVRMLHFNEEPILRATPPAEPSGRVVAAHYRRGTWRNIASGRRVWIRSSAIHGGGGSPPPWYVVA